MNNISEYRIATANNSKSLVNSVNELIRAGFQPLGPLAMCVDENDLYLQQPMVKTTEVRCQECNKPIS